MDELTISVLPDEVLGKEILFKIPLHIIYKGKPIHINIQLSENLIKPEDPYDFKCIELPDETVDKENGLVEDNFVNAMMDDLFCRFETTPLSSDERIKVSETIWEKIKEILDQKKITLPW